MYKAASLLDQTSFGLEECHCTSPHALNPGHVGLMPITCSLLQQQLCHSCISRMGKTVLAANSHYSIHIIQSLFN